MAIRTEAAEGRARRAPSGFVSCDNDDETAQNTFEIIRDASVPRDQTLIWNIVPWYVGDGQRIRAVEREDLQQAQPWLDELLNLLTDLEVVVLLGRKALTGWRLLAGERLTDLAMLSAPHPSPQVLNPSRTARQELSGTIEIAVKLLGPPA